MPDAGGSGIPPGSGGSGMPDAGAFCFSLAFAFSFAGRFVVMLTLFLLGHG
jgi:hypothetical protein